ncbi:hypothetical protein JCM8115_006163 [Rhodotorula mucilaginosa]
MTDLATVTAPPSTPQATNADSSRHHPTSRRQSHGLAGEEVLELTTFSEKKAWIDEKIQFLSALPEIKASEPEPPASPAATFAELEAWWEEHGRIEREIDEYDMGDLARMRQLARDKSKHALSPRDTDLIEITLTTLFSVDKLLHLLRHRRRALTLLRHRLQWEETTETAWERYRAIVESDLPAFLRHAQAASGPSRDPLRSSQRSSLSTSTSSTDLGASLRSLSASTSSRDLASNAGSSSTNRVQMSQLAYTTLTTNARTLSESLVPAAAASLDKLIDASPVPLPDSFLDAQDRLEEAVSALLGDGLDRFAAEVMRQSEMVVTMRIELDRVQEESNSLAAAATAEASSTPTREMLAELLGRLERIQTRVDDVQDQLWDLPRPRHSAVPSQSEHTASLVAEIETRLSSCRKSLSETSAVVDTYRQRLDVLTEVESLLREMQESSVRLEKLVGEASSSDGRPSCDLQLPDDDDSRQGSSTRRLFSEHAAACESRASSLSAAVLRAQDLYKRAARLVNVSRDVHLDASIRQDLRRASDDLREKVAEGSRILESETAHCERAVELSAWLLSLERCQVLVAEAESNARENLQLALWRDGTAAVIDDDGGTGARLMASIDAALADSSAKRRLVVDQARAPCAGPVALASLRKRTDELDERVRSLKARLSLIDRAHEQARAIEAVVESISSLRSRTFSVVSRAQRDGDLASPDEEEIDRIAKDFDHLRQNLHARVPFLAAGPSSTSSEVDLTSHDANVRSSLNEMCISTAGLIDSSRQSIMNATEKLARSDVYSPGSDKAQEAAFEVDAGDVPADRDANLEAGVPIPPPSEPPVRSEAEARENLDLSTTRKSPSQTDNAAPKVADDLFSPETGLQYSASKDQVSDDWLAPLEEPAAVRSVRRRIRAIPTLSWLSPSTLRLPGDADVEEIVAETADCTATLDGLLAESSEESLHALRDELDALEPATTRVQKLAAFAQCTSQTDAAFSGLLNHIDEADLQADRKDGRSEALSAAADAMTALHRAAIECADDLRVQRTLQRVESTYNELLDLLPPKTYPTIPAGQPTLPNAAIGTESTFDGDTRTSLCEMRRQGIKSPESSRSSSRASTARSSLSSPKLDHRSQVQPFDRNAPFLVRPGKFSRRHPQAGMDVASVDSPSSGTGFCVERNPTAQQGQRICLAGSSVDPVAVEANGEADIWHHTARCYPSARPQFPENRSFG